MMLPKLKISDQDRSEMAQCQNPDFPSPLEDILTTNRHVLNICRQTYISKPKSVRTSEKHIPELLKPHYLGSATTGCTFGYGPFYVPPCYPCMNTPPRSHGSDDSSVHPRNADPIHDPHQKCQEFSAEKVTGTRWLLEHLQNGGATTLDAKYSFDSYTVGKRAWATGTAILDENNIRSRKNCGLGYLRHESLGTVIQKPKLSGKTNTAVAAFPITAPEKRVNLFTPDPVECIPDTEMQPREFLAAFAAPAPIARLTLVPLITNKSEPETTDAKLVDQHAKQLKINGKAQVKVCSSGKKCYLFPVLTPKCGRPLSQSYIEGSRGSTRVRGGLKEWSMEVSRVIAKKRCAT